MGLKINIVSVDHPAKIATETASLVYTELMHCWHSLRKSRRIRFLADYPRSKFAAFYHQGALPCRHVWRWHLHQVKIPTDMHITATSHYNCR